MKDNASTIKFSYQGYLFSLLFIVMGCTWFIRGEYINHAKGIYIFGTQARLFGFILAIMAIVVGPCSLIKQAWGYSKPGAALLLFGLFLGIFSVGFIETHFSKGYLFLVDYLALLLSSLPGLVICAAAAEANRQIQMNTKAEQGVAPYVARGAPSGER